METVGRTDVQVGLQSAWRQRGRGREKFSLPVRHPRWTRRLAECTDPHHLQRVTRETAQVPFKKDWREKRSHIISAEEDPVLSSSESSRSGRKHSLHFPKTNWTHIDTKLNPQKKKKKKSTNDQTFCQTLVCKTGWMRRLCGLFFPEADQWVKWRSGLR